MRDEKDHLSTLASCVLCRQLGSSVGGAHARDFPQDPGPGSGSGPGPGPGCRTVNQTSERGWAKQVRWCRKRRVETFPLQAQALV